MASTPGAARPNVVPEHPGQLELARLFARELAQIGLADAAVDAKESVRTRSASP